MLKYGNWCGPNWSAGQWKEAKDLTEEDKQVEAVDSLDAACKNHDIGIAEGDPNANKRFWSEATKTGVTGVLFALAVSGAGPSLHNTLRGGKEITQRMETRAGKRKRLENGEIIRILAEQQGMSNNDVDSLIEQYSSDMDVEGEVYTSGSFTTPSQPPSRATPTMTRAERPLRGPRAVGSLTNLLDSPDTIMEDVSTALVSRSSQTSNNAGDGQRGNKETPVMYNSRTEMGIFTETRTAYLPITVYFSINRTGFMSSIPLHFRVDWPHNIFSKNTLAQQQLRISSGEGFIRNRGVSNDMVKHGVRATGYAGITAAAGNFGDLGVTNVDPAINRGQLFPFPTTVVGSFAALQGTPVVQASSSYGGIADSKAICAYRKWYAKMYSYAHCMETDWKVTYFSGESNEEFQNMRVYEGMDCVSTGNTDTIPTTVELGTIDHWAYLKKHDLSTRTTEKPSREYTISGKWTPDINHPMKMVANTEEIKTWTKLSDGDFGERTPNQYREDVTLLHYSHPDSCNQAAFNNVRIDLRYKVQFKDLAGILRWPRLPQTAISLSSVDCLQVPTPTTATGHLENPERVFCDGVNPR